MAELPSGAVTFLFTDIEGSTQLVRKLRGEWPAVLAEHQRLLREAFTAHGGHEIDTQGDSFFFAFPSAHEAVLAAVEGQRALSGYPWPEDGQVKVRMGIHTGQAAPVDGRYTGLAVHRAARIHAAAHGGQVLASQATQSLLEDEEEDLQVKLRDLGEQRLKDIDRPVRVYQVAAAGLPQDFPPPRQEAEPTEPPSPRPLYRRPLIVAAAALLVAGIAAVVAVLALGGGGPGGLSQVHPNHVGVIDPKTNRIVEEIQVGLRPGPIAVGEGAVWVGNLEDKTLSRVDLKTKEVRTISLDNRTPTDVAVGAGGVWVAHSLFGSVSRVDPRYGEVTKLIPVADRSLYGSVAVGDGSVWAAFGDSTIAKIDPRAGRVVARSSAFVPVGIAYGGGVNAVWVVSRFPEYALSRFSPFSFESGAAQTLSLAGSPTAISAFGDVAWATSPGPNVVSKIQYRGGITTFPVGGQPVGVAAGPDAVWVATRAGTISRLDPTSGEIVSAIRTGNPPSDVAIGGGRVWVTVQRR